MGESPGAPTSACLVVIYGDELGRRFDVDTSPMTIGRALDCDITLTQDSVSRHHATLVLSEDGVRIRDDGSRNGTFVNDQEITSAPLSDGDLLRINRTIFKFFAGDGVEASFRAEVARLNRFDGLTNVHNRRYFLDDLEERRSAGREAGYPVSICVFDIDGLTKVNKTYGRRAGDLVLCGVADAIAEAVGERTLVARCDSNCFAIVLDKQGVDAAFEMAERVREKVAGSSTQFESVRIQPTVTGMVAELAEMPDGSFVMALQALKVAKRDVTNQTFKIDEVDAFEISETKPNHSR